MNFIIYVFVVQINLILGEWDYIFISIVFLLVTSILTLEHHGMDSTLSSVHAGLH